MKTKKASTFFYNFVDIAGAVIFIVLGVAILWLGSTSSEDSVDEQLEEVRTPYATIDFLNKLAQTPLELNGEVQSYATYLSEYIALRNIASPSSAQEKRLTSVATLLRSASEEAQDQDLSRITITVHEYFQNTALESYDLYGRNADVRTAENSIALPYYQPDSEQKKILYLQASFADDRFQGGRNR
jgi:hypothetical protein